MTNLHADDGSFKDPAGRVYRVRGEHGERVIRALRLDALEDLTRLLSAPFFRRLMQDGDVVRTWMLDARDAHVRRIGEGGSSWQGAIEHQPIDFLTWPYEWPFSMLKDAALLQLRLLATSIPHGWTLKDATPFNVQWPGTRPTFIDVPSFIPWSGQYWHGYRQFCATYLTPLLMAAHLGIPSQPLLRARLEGIPAEEALRYFPGLRRFRRGVPSHVWFPAKAERAAAKASARRKSSGKQSQTALLALVESLRRLVSSLSYRPASPWTGYSGTHSYADADYDKKERFVAEQTAARRPHLVWDLGANTGHMAQVAARSAGVVIAVDSDHDAIELLYRKISGADQPRNVVPLVVDIANPSPGLGWAGRERPAFDSRRKPDMVLCLALIHHVRVAANVPLALLLDWLCSLQATIVIEFVERRDEMFKKLLANKEEQYADYTRENFDRQVARRFRVRARLPLKDGLRELLLLDPR